MTRSCPPYDLANLRRAMNIIAEAVDDLPSECRTHVGNALLNMAAETEACSGNGHLRHHPCAPNRPDAALGVPARLS